MSDMRETQKQPTEPIQSVTDASTEVSQGGPISNLPSEVLTQILSYILTKPGPITLHSASPRRWRNEAYSLSKRNFGFRYVAIKSVKSPLLDILLVSRSFYFAGIEAFFGENVFKFDDIRHLELLTSKLDTDRRRCIRRIRFQVRFQDTYGDHQWVGEANAGERLSVCLERLPSLTQVRFSSQAMNYGSIIPRHPHHVPMVLQLHAERNRRLFEGIKESCGSRRELLELELTDYRGDEIGVEEEELDPDL